MGCAADDGAGPGPAPTTVAGELADVNATPRERLAEGGTLRRAVERLPSQWNPLHLAGGDVSASEIRGPLSVTNWDTDARGVTTPNENFVTDVEDTVADGREVVTLHLNPDAVWNSGEPITWADYAATVAACSGTRPDFECATHAFGAIESVTHGESEFDVVVTFAGTFPDWPALLGTVLPAAGVADAETFNAGWLDHPEEWFTGPFRLDEVDAAQQVVKLVPNERWWGPAPKLDEIQYRAVSPDAAASAFANHELDVLDVGADANAYQRALAVPDAEVRRAAGPDWRQITFNATAGPLTDPDVRQAVARAIDRDAVAASSLAGLPEELQRPLDNHIFMQGQEGYEDNAGAYAYDPGAAAAQLDAAGWVLNPDTGVRERDGEPLTLRYTVFSGVPASANEGQLVQAQLKEVGIAVELDAVPETALGPVLGEGDFELIGFSWYGSPYPLLAVANLYGDPATTPTNYARLAVPGLDDLLGQLMTETDHATRLGLADRADELLWDAMPILPLYQRPQLVATARDLANVGASGLGSTRAEDWGYVG
ncbi:ABC transporter family substrate-binding protein [Georgenia ruanii]|uniref:ABC transporter family substrate-binding protein n=1 Tax=Georgenia ruanii TaxID=348442 RepID=A0A7J9UWS1_9MICO|nr:ABC transporter family substrate-binding protein [Georgenia ruanii]